MGILDNKILALSQKQNRIIIQQPTDADKWTALQAFLKALKIKFEISKDVVYNPEFIEKIEKSKKQYEDADFISVEKKAIKNFLDLE